jgi:hypothetical protein
LADSRDLVEGGIPWHAASLLCGQINAIWLIGTVGGFEGGFLRASPALLPGFGVECKLSTANGNKPFLVAVTASEKEDKRCKR